MKYISFLLFAIIGCANSPKEKSADTNLLNNQSSSRSLDSVAAVTVVQDFFRAFDEKDLKKIDSLFPPSMKIIHHNGATTNTTEMVQIINETKDWWPRTRRLSNYEFTSNGDLSILGLKNEVTFSLPSDKKVYEPYNETWIFEKMNDKWRPIRCHYSKITVDKHSEDVK
ncbi:MAG: nuclear transport factor 2 family protein [Ferruginibacter sp.]